MFPDHFFSQMHVTDQTFCHFKIYHQCQFIQYTYITNWIYDIHIYVYIINYNNTQVPVMYNIHIYTR